MKILKVARNKLYLESNLEEQEIVDVSPEIISEMDLNRKKELSREEYRRVIYLASLAKSIFLLSRRDYSRKEMLGKLRMKFREYGIVEEVVEKLVDRGYINDLDYARALIERSRESRRKLEYQLSMKGIGREVIAEAFGEADHDERDELRKQLKKVAKREKDKQIAYLMRKGFRYEDIREVMREIEE
ncbi:hypothetical protein PM10SUCC1_29720 [Propionigenium maris DSM 9537]|uniref:Regulatory protein RecX n=1 Tax=Propionigenium maris DSM 9537 TaxID=1123000 RepID=A0A9W6GLT8_9FUSO|nr:regulatory protein RecX [Propionigenium maris]GLI57458.1 hypothetical protein PM10SUCC1_29720 [Propionigenium maris DSM 9537]